MTIREHASGDIIFQEGHWGNTLCELLEGRVGVYVGYESGQEKLLTELEEGAIFGEMAVLEPFPRSATVVVLSEKAKVKVISGQELADFFQEKPEELEKICFQLGERLDRVYDDYEKVRDALARAKEGGREEADQDLLTHISRFLSVSLLHPNTEHQEALGSLEAEPMSEKYAERMKTYQAGQVIFREGEAPRYLYYVTQGGVGLCQGYGTDKEKLISKIRADEFFGELGLMAQKERRLTAVALQADTKVHLISRDALNYMFRKFPSFGLLILRDFSSQLRAMTGEYIRLCKELAQLKKLQKL